MAPFLLFSAFSGTNKNKCSYPVSIIIQSNENVKTAFAGYTQKMCTDQTRIWIESGKQPDMGGFFGCLSAKEGRLHNEAKAGEALDGNGKSMYNRKMNTDLIL